MKKNIMFKNAILLLSGSLLSLGSCAQTASTNYHILKKDHIGGTGGWDYITVNPEMHRIYVSHGTQVNILDEVSGDSVGVIQNTNGVHGVTIINSLGKGYTSNGRSNNISVFDLKSNKVLQEIAVGKNPDAIFYDDFTKKIFICNGGSNDASVLDPAADKLIATIPLGGKPETAVSDGKGNVFINIEDKNEVLQLNAMDHTVKKRWKLLGGEEPTGLAIDRQTNRLFVGCGNKLMFILDADSGKTLMKLPIGAGCDGVAFDQEKKLVFASNGEGTITVVKEFDADKFAVVQTVKTEPGARTLTINPKNHRILLPVAALSATKKGKNGWPLVVPNTFHVLEIGE